MLTALPLEIPSPTTGVWNLGPLPVRAYAMCILAGIVVAIWMTQRRLATRGGTPGQVLDISAWAVPFGIVGGRIYHLITSPQAYFGEGGEPVERVQGVGGRSRHLGGHRPRRARRVHRLPRARACASSTSSTRLRPGILVAQAIGRFGNYFNNEIHGAPTDLPWGLKVYEWDPAAGHAVLDANGNPVVLGVFHPTFLYEAIFCLLLAGLLIWLDRRHDFRRGQIFALYVAGYPIGRGVIEFMRTDDANHILGLRVNSWVSILVVPARRVPSSGSGADRPSRTNRSPNPTLKTPAKQAESQHSE